MVVIAYNAADYLDRCLASILRQTFQNFELIAVDDGSTDATPDILNQYQAVIMIRQENLGTMRARQRGIEAATGDYLIMVDADDWLVPTALEQLYQHAAKTQSDIVCHGCLLERRPMPFHPYNYALWLRVFKMDLVKSIDLGDIPSVYLCEDFILNALLSLNAAKTTVCWGYPYVKTVRRESLSYGFSQQWFQDLQVAVHYLSGKIGQTHPELLKRWVRILARDVASKKFSHLALTREALNFLRSHLPDEKGSGNL